MERNLENENIKLKLSLTYTAIIRFAKLLINIQSLTVYIPTKEQLDYVRF